MKSIYFWIVTVLMTLGVFPATAQDEMVEFTVNVPYPEGISCQINGEPYTLEKGANKFNVAQYTNLYFSSVAPYRITGVTDKSGTAVSSFYGDSWYLTAYPEINDEVYTIAMQNIDEFRTSSLTINVDDASLVSAMLGGYYTNLSLKDGENTIKFDPAVETYITINGTAGPIYKVELNGTAVTPQDGNSYTISNLENGWIIDITAILPEEDRTVSFKYSEKGWGALKVEVNNQEVEEFDNNTLVVQLGDQLTLIPKQDFQYDSVTLNGKELGSMNYEGKYTFFPTSFYVMEDSEVYVDAHPFGNIKVTVTISNPELITFFKGYEYENNIVALQPGDNELEMMENSSFYSWKISENAICNSVTLNGEPLSSYTTQVTFKEGDILVFDVTEKVFDLRAILWIDNPKGQYCSGSADGSGYGYLSFGSQEERSSECGDKLVKGYNEIFFYAGMNPFNASWYSSNPDYKDGKIYLNDTLLEPMYEGSTSFSIDLANNDVLKFFMDGAPVECQVEFSIAEEVEVDIVKDIVTEVENPSSGFDCFAGTQVSIFGDGIKVSVNGEVITAQKPDEEMAARTETDIYTFIINEPSTKVSVEKDSESGIEMIGMESAAADVYNTLGAKVGTTADINQLTPGLYIVKGKKILVK